MKTIIINLICLFGIYSIVCGQNINITGAVISSDLSPITHAHIELKQQKDSTILTSAISDDMGKFNISGIAPNQAILEISHLSFHTKYIKIPNICDTSIVAILKPKVINLNEATVVAQVPSVRYTTSGDIIVNMENLKDNDIDNAEDAIKKMPGVIITDNLITLFGEKVQLQLDGIDVNINPMIFLRSRPASYFAEAELILEATGSYGDGNAVINLKSKRKKYNGYSSSITMDSDFNKPSKK